jgi:hypothetical protein
MAVAMTAVEFEIVVAVALVAVVLVAMVVTVMVVAVIREAVPIPAVAVIVGHALAPSVEIVARTAIPVGFDDGARRTLCQRRNRSGSKR